jgi:hypothetical protein
MAFQEWNARILLNSLLGVPQILAFGSLLPKLAGWTWLMNR